MTDLLYELFYVTAMSAGVLSLLSENLIGKETNILTVIITVIISSVLVIFKRVKWTGRMIMISTFIMIIIAGFFLSKNESVYEWILSNKGYIWIPAISAAAFLIGELMVVSGIVRVTVCVAATVWMTVCTVTGYSVEKLFVAVTFLLILLTLVEGVQARWEKQGQVGRKGHLVFVSPFIILIFIFVLLSPAPDEPYDWGLAKKIYEVVTDTAQNIFDGIAGLFTEDRTTNPAEAKIGFSERGDISGSISGGDGDALLISGLSSYVDQIRLIGKTFTDFDGRSWTDNDSSDAHATLMDTIAMCASLDDFTDRDNDFARRSYIKIEYDGINTDHVFLPLKSIPKNYGLQTGGYVELGGDVLWPEKRSGGSMYETSYYLLNRDNDVFKSYLESQKKPTENSYDHAEKILNTDRLAGCKYADYLKYMDHIRNNYSEAPKLSPKLRARMDEVYRGAKTDYEKMQRLEAMLREYEYSLNPGPIPDSVNNAGDFLDYLLFENRKGFCSHYATAFVLLARAEGMPARYVQGYAANTGGKTSIFVKKNNAHAWPEVYFDGAGWISFEPTPSLNEGHSYWKTASEKEAQSPLITNISSDEVSDGAEDGFRINIDIKWYMIVIPLAVGILLVIFSLILGHVVSAMRFKRMNDEDKLVALCKTNLRILRIMGAEIRKNETLFEYGNRLKETGIEGSIFLVDYERYLYKEELADGALKRAEESKKILLKELKNRSVFKYIIFGRIRYD